MRILLLMDPWIPVPPTNYGGIERVVYDIACCYKEMGHDVTIIAGPNSKSPGRLITYGKNASTQSIKLDYSLLWKVSSILYREIGKHDVIHNFGRLAYLFPIAWSKIRKVQTYMRYIDQNNIRRLNKLGARNIIYTAVSDAIVNTGAAGGGNWRTVYNCAPVEFFNFSEKVSDEAPLVFLGRLERCKGVHNAIEVAKITGRKLVIAGNISPLPEEKEYFEKELKPHFDNELITYIGVVDNARKNSLLGNAYAMLLPVQWFEPFPIVLPEAYACGTPILAFPGGGVPEGIIEGKTGFISTTAEQMAEQVALIPTISRAYCREIAESKYSDRKIASNYLQIYNEC